MSAVNSWDIDNWLESLGIDPCTDVVMAQYGANIWGLEVRIPAGQDADEYLYYLDQAWQDQFGPAYRVEFKAYVRKTIAEQVKELVPPAFAPYWVAGTSPRGPSGYVPVEFPDKLKALLAAHELRTAITESGKSIGELAAKWGARS